MKVRFEDGVVRTLDMGTLEEEIHSEQARQAAMLRNSKNYTVLVGKDGEILQGNELFLNLLATSASGERKFWIFHLWCP